MKEVLIVDELGNETTVSAILYIRNSFGEVIEEYSLDDGGWMLDDSESIENGQWTIKKQRKA